MKTRPSYYKSFAAFLCLAVASVTILGILPSHVKAQSPPNFKQDVEPKLSPRVEQHKDEAKPLPAEVNFLRRALNSTVRIDKLSGSRGWTDWGSGTIFRLEEGYYYVLTNNHVAGNVGEGPYIEVFRDGFSRGRTQGKVVYSVKGNGLDLAIIKLKVTKENEGQELSPIRVGSLAKNTKIFSVGCDAAHAPNGHFSHIVSATANQLQYTPGAWPGDSGGSIFTADGKGIVGLCAWHDPNGVNKGIAMTSKVIMENVNKYDGKVKQETTPRKRIAPNFLDLLRRASEESKAGLDSLRTKMDSDTESIKKGFNSLKAKAAEDSSSIRKLLDGVHSQLDGVQRKLESYKTTQETAPTVEDLGAIEDQYTAQFGLLKRLRANQDEGIDMIQKESDEYKSRLDRLTSKFDGFMGKARLAFYLLCAIGVIVVATLFFGPGWLLIFVGRCLGTFVKLIKSIISIVSLSLTRPTRKVSLEEHDTLKERLEIMQKELNDASK